MKNATLRLLLAMTMSATAFAQETPNVTGGNFSLEGALEMFKKSENLEAFEKAVNEEQNNVNNLDLNGDSKTDYVTVEDIKDGDAHVIVLSTWLSENEKQDIATIGIEKTGADSATLQIEGDEDLYAVNTIVEPVDEKEIAKGGNNGPGMPEIASLPIVVNVWAWPAVRFIYAPAYVVWVSPYRWNVYPRWWRPWRPVRFAVFRPRTVVYHTHYKPVTVRRVAVAHGLYQPRRRSSTAVVHTRRATTVVRKNNRTGKTTVVRKNNRTGKIRARRR